MARRFAGEIAQALLAAGRGGDEPAAIIANAARPDQQVILTTLSGLAAHDWQNLVVLWSSIALAFFFIELRGAGPELAWISDFKTRLRPKPKLYVVQKSSTRTIEPDDVYASVDPILDKISKSGMGSLTETERKILDRARNRLLKKSD